MGRSRKGCQGLVVRCRRTAAAAGSGPAVPGAFANPGVGLGDEDRQRVRPDRGHLASKHQREHDREQKTELGRSRVSWLGMHTGPVVDVELVRRFRPTGLSIPHHHRSKAMICQHSVPRHGEGARVSLGRRASVSGSLSGNPLRFGPKSTRYSGMHSRGSVSSYPRMVNSGPTGLCFASCFRSPHHSITRPSRSTRPSHPLSHQTIRRS